MVPAEDIEKMAQAVLNLQLPRSADHIQSVIGNISDLLSGAANLQEDLGSLEERSRISQDLLQNAQELRLASQNTS